VTGLNNYLATIKDSQVEKKDDISSSNNNNSNRRSLGKDPRSKVNSTAEPKPPGQDTARRNALEALRGIHEAVEGRGHSDSLGQLKGLLTPEQGEAAGGGGVVGAADNLKEELLSAQQLIAQKEEEMRKILAQQEEERQRIERELERVKEEAIREAEKLKEEKAKEVERLQQKLSAKQAKMEKKKKSLRESKARAGQSTYTGLEEDVPYHDLRESDKSKKTKAGKEQPVDTYVAIDAYSSMYGDDEEVPGSLSRSSGSTTTTATAVSGYASPPALRANKMYTNEMPDSYYAAPEDDEEAHKLDPEPLRYGSVDSSYVYNLEDEEDDDEDQDEGVVPNEGGSAVYSEVDEGGGGYYTDQAEEPEKVPSPRKANVSSPRKENTPPAKSSMRAPSSRGKAVEKPFENKDWNDRFQLLMKEEDSEKKFAELSRLAHDVRTPSFLPPLPTLSL